MRMYLHSKTFTMLKEPNVKAMQLITLHANAKPIGKLVCGLPRYVCRAYLKSLPFLHTTPKNEAFRASTSRSAQLSVSLLHNRGRHNESGNCLKCVHDGGGP